MRRKASWQIERAAHKQLAAQVKALEAENARLKEDLAFFDSLLPAGTGSEGISIRRLEDRVDWRPIRFGIGC